MNLKKIIKNNAKLYIIMGIIIVLGMIGITFALTTNFNPIAINITSSTIDANITYDEGSNSAEITTTEGDGILPIDDSIVEQEGANITDTRVLKATFNVSGLATNPANTIYDVALYSNDAETTQGIDCELRTEDVKWRLYKNGVLLSNGNLSPTFDVMNNGRLVLTNTQQDLTTTEDKYTFILWISESCTGDITTCDQSLDQSKYLNKKLNVSLKVELATKSKKTLERTTGDPLSCDYTGIDIPACNKLTYNDTDQTLLNTSNYYTIENNTGNNVGTYTSILKLKDGYKWSDETTEEKVISCNILKKDLKITTLPQTISYGTSLSSSSNNITVKGLITGHKISKILLSQGDNVVKASNAVILDSSNNDVTNNYEITYINTGTLITNCMNNATLPETIDQTYTGEKLTGITGGTNVDIQGIKTATEAGTYEVTVTPKNNYCWTDGTTTSKTLTWTILLDGITTIYLNNLVTTNNGTRNIYYKDNTYYKDTDAIQNMTTTENPIIRPVKVGYSFEGYYTEENGNGTQMIDRNGYATKDLLNTNPNQSTYALRSTHTTLYAYWKQKTYTITYDANGGTNAPAAQTKIHGETITLSGTKPTKNNLEFLGWSTNKNANTATYSPSDAYTINANITLYAIWTGYQEFTITSSNRNMIGYTDDTTDLIIPSTFQAEDGTWYEVTSIGGSAFQNCKNLTSITIPDSVTTIGSSAFYGCTSLTSITIPDSITTINTYAFQNCKNLTSITIPDSVTTIGAYAFSGCTSLTSITIPDSVTTIGAYAFYNCTSLTSITIPDSVTSIGRDAFHGCTSLTSITIPDSVTLIDMYAFINCTRLESITVNTNNKSYASLDGVLYTKNLDKLIQYPSGKTNTTFTIPDSVTTIGTDAFYNCTSLTSITIPDSVTSINGYPFKYCSALKSIIVNTNNNSYASLDGVLYTKNLDKLIRYPSGKTNTTFTIPDSVTTINTYAFQNCKNLTSITIPDSVTTISSSAFYGCTGLTNITIPDSVTSIENSAFQNCTGLTSFIIPSSVTYWGGWIFKGCSRLTSITISDGVTVIDDYLFSGCTGLTNITIPDSVTTIGQFAFEGCTGLTSFTIPDSVTSIERNAFYNCTNLTNITIPDSVTTIGSSAFEGCTSLTSIIIPDSVTSINGFTFEGCTSLTSITIPDSVTSIGTYAFDGCTGLTSITIPDSVTSIGTYAFYGCTGLTSFIIPNNVTTIGSSAFRNCTNITSITIPDSVTSIGTYAFYGCTSLTNIYYTGTEAQWNNISIDTNNTPLSNATKHYEYVAS